MSNIVIIYGTLSEEIRLEPVIEKLKQNNISVLPVQTGQQELQLKENFIYSNQVLARNLVDRQSLIMKRLNDVLDKESFDAILVVGNTLSAFCGALYGYLRKIRIFHLNAGQQTYNLHNAFPEEGLGQMITRLTNVHLVTTKFAYKNLVKEGVNKKSIFIVGNTLQDIIETKYLSNRVDKDEILFSIHRKENIKNIKSICMAINYLTKNYQDYIFNIILPRNIDMAKEMQQYLLYNTNLNILNTIKHDEMLNLINRSKLIYTDGFGTLEEATILCKPTFILREYMESIESLKTNVAKILLIDYYTIIESFNKFIKNKIKFKIKKCKYYKKDAVTNIYTIIDLYLKKQ